MILPAQIIRMYCSRGDREDLVFPFFERKVHQGFTFGLSAAGYDVRIAEGMVVPPGGFVLGSTVEHFNIPNHVIAFCKDKSSLARQGLVVQNTVFEPGWRGYATLELTNHSLNPLMIFPGSPIAQIIFQTLMEPTEQPYNGKYQDQKAGAQPAIFEK